MRILSSLVLLLAASNLSDALVVERQDTGDVQSLDADTAAAATSSNITFPWDSDPDLWELPATSKVRRASSNCKCGPTDPCWPSDTVWTLFSALLGGRLIKTVPIGSSCHTQTIVDKTTYSAANAAQCSVVQNNWHTPDFHELSSSSIMTPYFANNSCSPFEPASSTCLMGTYVRYAVNVSSVTDVRLAMGFAFAYNIRFVIRNTGHDFMGKSTGYGALSIWTHHVRGMSINKNYQSAYYSGPAIKGYAGTTVGELYNFTHDAGYLAVGGECSTVGWAGGYTSGGGHSALTSWKGLAADQTLEFEVIIADGQLITASRYQNSDLWWALSGGGPGNYGIIWSMTTKVYPDVSVAAGSLIVPQGTATDDAFWQFIDYYHTLVPAYTKGGAYAYAFYLKGYFQMVPFFAPNQTLAQVDAQTLPLLQKLKALGIAYTYSSTSFSNFRDAFYGSFAPINTGLYQFGGRLIPSSVLTGNPTGFSAALRHIVNGGGSLIEPGIAPSLSVSGNPGNSVLPAWRDAAMYLIPAAQWNDTAGSWPQNLAVRSTITNDWDMQLKAIAPNSGAYMSEADQDNLDWKVDWYGANYNKLLAIKQKYDPCMFFYAPKAVGSDYWTIENDGTMCQT